MRIATLDGRFEWDSRKSIENMRKHRIRFSEITSVFDDPFLLAYYDSLHSSEENRYLAIGSTGEGLLVFVCFVLRDDRIRIISARRCNGKEKEIYRKNVQKIIR